MSKQTKFLNKKAALDQQSAAFYVCVQYD